MAGVKYFIGKKEDWINKEPKKFLYGGRNIFIFMEVGYD